MIYSVGMLSPFCHIVQGQGSQVGQLGQDRVSQRFRSIASRGKTGLIVFLTAGFPDLRATQEMVPALAAAGADLIEIGVPFSDPLADGPTIQASSYQALRNGATLRWCIEQVGALRKDVADTPLILMGYYNPVLSYGLSRFARDAQEAGVDGVIVPDLPPDEAGPLLEECRPLGIHVVPLLAPTSNDRRIQMACRMASGFIYCVSITGVTGVRDQLPQGVFDLLRKVRRHTELPLVAGFGISRRDHIDSLGGAAQAVVVGSALIKVIMESSRQTVVEKACRFVAQLSANAPSVQGGHGG